MLFLAGEQQGFDFPL